MEICFRDQGVYAVRFTCDKERDRLLDTVEGLGIRVNKDRWKGKHYWPQNTNTFAIDLNQKLFIYQGEPHICAAMAGSGVRFYSASEFCRLAELGFPRRTRCPIFHVPHDGREFPAELMASVCIPEEQFMAYHEKMLDFGIWHAIPHEYWVPFQSEHFSVSRLLCDVERFTGPEEVMERYGMGFCYERAYDGTKIKNVTEELKAKTLRYYRAHHERMDRICREHKRVLLIDLHSYSDEIVPRDFLCAGIETPDVCIGTDARFTPPRLAQLTQKRFQDAGFSTALNYPYSGCYVPNAALQSEIDCASIMLEFNKRVYMGDIEKKNAPMMGKISAIIREIVAEGIVDA